MRLHGREFEDLLAGDEDDDDDEDDEDDGASDITASAMDDDAESSVGASSAAGSSASKRGASKKQQADLRRRLLKSQAESSAAAKEAAAEEHGDEAQATATANGAGDAEMADATAIADGVTATADADVEAEAANADAAVDTNGSWINTDINLPFNSQEPTAATGSAGASLDGAAAMREQNFFCNSSFYVFVRLLQILYARLHKMRTLASDKAAAFPAKQRNNPVAVELGLQDGSTGPAAVVGAVSTTSGANAAEDSGLFLHPSRYYDTVLDLCEKLFDGDLDQATFEETVRYMYGIEGYHIFTIDKVVAAFVKAVSCCCSL